MEPPEDMEGRSFVEVMSEKYSPENFPYRRGPGIGVVVVPTAGPQGSPMKGELEVNNDWLRLINRHISMSFFYLSHSKCRFYMWLERAVVSDRDILASFTLYFKYSVDESKCALSGLADRTLVDCIMFPIITFSL